MAVAREALAASSAVVDRSPARIVIEIEEAAYPDFVALGVLYDSDDGGHTPKHRGERLGNKFPGFSPCKGARFCLCSARTCAMAFSRKTKKPFKSKGFRWWAQ